uniref:hypothetical protein n=1 Tax=Falsiroseomonas oryzae TaxID=2766473 RepID=UPI0022EB59B5
ATWRVVADGTTGCADPAVLRQLRAEPEPDAAALRRLAAARAAGGCVTVFRSLPWRVLDSQGEILRLGPADGGAEGARRAPGPLYFWRNEVAEDRGI